MQTPVTVRVTAALMFLSLLIGTVIVFTVPVPATANAPAAMGTIMKGLHAFFLVFAILEAVVVFFYLKGHNWARWLVMLDSLLQLVSLLQIGKSWRTSHLSAELMIFNALFGIFLLIYLNTAEAKAYFMQPKAS